jgi:glutathione S-transferase
VDTPAYRRLNANGLVPTIEDDGFVLWESNAIVRYLAAKHAAGQLWPHAPEMRGHADQWLDWSATTFFPAMRALFVGLIRTPPEKRDPQAIEDSRTKTAETLRILDAHLVCHEFLAGNAFTMGDIALGCGIWRWMALPIERPELRNVQRWFDTLAQRPPYKKVVMLPLS